MLKYRTLQILLLGLAWVLSMGVARAQLSEAHQRLIASYEGFPPIPFEAPDINGQRHFLPDYKDKVLLLFFWNLECEACKAYLGMMNDLALEFQNDDFQVLSLADEEKPALLNFTQNSLVNFPVIPNGRGLGEMGYALELGYPRVFLIDKYGIIQKVMTGDDQNIYGQLKSAIEKYLQQ